MSRQCGAPTRSGAPCRRWAGPDGRCSSHPEPEPDPETIRGWIDRALSRVEDDWRTALARKLADTLDEAPYASMARELRALMGTIDPGAARRAAKKEGTVVDDLAARRAERRAAAGIPE